MTEINQADLDGFVLGEREAFERLFRRYQGEVFRWAVRIVRDAGVAEEVVVDAFWRAYRGRAGFDPGRGFGPWIRRIATRAALDHLKAARRRPVLVREAATEPPARPGPDAAVAECVALAFQRLSPNLRVIATLALIEEQSYAEIAEVLDVPVGTVKSRVFRAVRSLRTELAKLRCEP